MWYFNLNNNGILIGDFLNNQLVYNGFGLKLKLNQKWLVAILERKKNYKNKQYCQYYQVNIIIYTVKYVKLFNPN